MADTSLDLARRFIAAGEREPDLPEWHKFTQQLAVALIAATTDVAKLRGELARAYPIAQAASAFLDEAPDLVDSFESVGDLARVVDRTNLYTDEARISMLPARLRGGS